MLGLLRRKKKDNEQVVIGAAIVTEKSVQQATAKADVTFKKPAYNPQTRKSHYDDAASRKAAKDSVFSENKVVKDPYTGAELVSTVKEAKLRYGDKWQEHLAESDHIDPLSQIAKRAEKKPWVTTDDVKEVANSQDNFQIISRRMNQNGGKGGSTQKEWSQDYEKIEQISEQTGESTESIAERIRKTGEKAEKRNDAKIAKASVKNMVNTAHAAGKTTAINSSGTAATISAINNMVLVIEGKKNASDALKDIGEDSTKAYISGYAGGAGLTVLNHTLTSSGSKFLTALGKNNVAGKAITAVTVTGDTVVKWGNGEISTGDCLIELGGKGCNLCGAYLGTMAGQFVIPIPIVGSAVGSLVGSVLTDQVYNGIVNKIQSAKEEERRKQQEIYEKMKKYIAEQNRRKEVQQLIKISTESAVKNSIQTIIKSSEFRNLFREVGLYFENHAKNEIIIAEYVLVTLQLQEYRRQLQECINNYFAEYREAFEEALNLVDLSLELGDYNSAICGTNQVAKLFGKEPIVESTEDFKKKIFENGRISL